jgi:hypothetical protein
MARFRLLRGWGGILLVGLLGMAAPTGGTAEDAARVTTDTAAYCDALRAEVETARAKAARAVQQEVTVLETEGTHLCQTGQVRGGIIRLRRALTLMHPASPLPSP